MARAMLGQSPQGFTPFDGRYGGSETENATHGLPSCCGWRMGGMQEKPEDHCGRLLQRFRERCW